MRSVSLVSLVGCGRVGPSTASLVNQALVYCGCPARTHGCDLVSRVRLDQSANPVVVWLGLVSRVVESSWRREICVYPNTPLRPGRGHELVDSGIIAFFVSSPQHCDLDDSIPCCPSSSGRSFQQR